MRKDQVKRVLRRGKNATEALFSSGDSPENVPGFRNWLGNLGYESFVDYVLDLCKLAVSYGLLPHTNIGVLTYDEIRKLRPFNASMGLMLESTAILDAHEYSPSKHPKLRLGMIENAGKLKIPFTTGILVGIGETGEDRIDSLVAIRDLHERYDHIQEVIIQPFHPKPGTPMGGCQAPSFEEMKDTVEIAREILPDDVAVQIPPNLANPKELIWQGASDLGGISEVTIDYINPEADWPKESELREMIRPFGLRQRLPIYPKYIRKRWYGDELAGLIEKHAGGGI